MKANGPKVIIKTTQSHYEWTQSHYEWTQSHYEPKVYDTKFKEAGIAPKNHN